MLTPSCSFAEINVSSQAQNLPLLFCLLLDGHTDSDILMKWMNPTIDIGNKQMAQFSVGDAILSTKVNSYSTGKKECILMPFKKSG